MPHKSQKAMSPAHRRKLLREAANRQGTPAILDMKYAFMRDPKDRRATKIQNGEKLPLDPNRVMNAKQIRKRARRRGYITDEEALGLYKPLDEWDAEELARGRPRNANGTFAGAKPNYVNRAFHEQILSTFEKIVKSEMNVHTVTAMGVIQKILSNEERDKKGRPLVPAVVKLDAAKYLVDHVIGKPVRRVENEVSVTLQGMLAHAMVNPTKTNFDEYQLTQGYIDAEVVDDSMGDKNNGD